MKDKLIANDTVKTEKMLKYASEYGTPLYVYDGDLILKRYKDFYENIRWHKLKILYAMKANYNVGILALLRDNDGFLDTVSPGEVHLALKLGYKKENILYTANNITDDEMYEVHELGILFNIGSLTRLEKFAQSFPGSKVCLRFNPDVLAGENKYVMTAGDVSKFGILLSEVEDVKRIIEKYDIKVIGLHEHTGSGISETEKVYQSINNLLAIAKKENFPDLEFIDFGGGFKVQYDPLVKSIDIKSFGEKVSQIFSDFCKEYGKELYMYFEPGKYIVAESGTLLMEVNTLKKNKDRVIAGTNSGFNHLIRPLLYRAYHFVENLSNPKGPLNNYDISGNLCETGDLFAENRELPEIREGDILAVHNGGAYCYSMGSIYNMRSMPSEILVVEGKEKLITKKLSNEELAESIFKSGSV